MGLYTAPVPLFAAEVADVEPAVAVAVEFDFWFDEAVAEQEVFELLEDELPQDEAPFDIEVLWRNEPQMTTEELWFLFMDDAPLEEPPVAVEPLVFLNLRDLWWTPEPCLWSSGPDLKENEIQVLYDIQSPRPRSTAALEDLKLPCFQTILELKDGESPLLEEDYWKSYDCGNIEELINM
jgi:hypothetical protein